MKGSKLFLTAAFLWATLAPPAAIAQQAADSREAQIDHVISGLNSLDPAKRLATFEEAMAGNDSTLRRVALSTAFASSDADLRSIALDKAVASVNTFVVEITGTGTASCSTGWVQCKPVFQNGLGSNFEVRMTHFDNASGTFEDWAGFSGRRLKPQPVKPSVYPPQPVEYETIMHAGSISGDRLSFEVDASGLTGWPGADGYGYTLQAACRGVARLEGGDAVLKGSMTCSGRDNMDFSDTENFSIEINVLA